MMSVITETPKNLRNRIKTREDLMMRKTKRRRLDEKSVEVLAANYLQLDNQGFFEGLGNHKTTLTQNEEIRKLQTGLRTANQKLTEFKALNLKLEAEVDKLKGAQIEDVENLEKLHKEKTELEMDYVALNTGLSKEIYKNKVLEESVDGLSKCVNNMKEDSDEKMKEKDKDLNNAHERTREAHEDQEDFRDEMEVRVSDLQKESREKDKKIEELEKLSQKFISLQSVFKDLFASNE